jgi:hypothetical protein
MTVLRNKTPVKIRLHGIDCPEKRQAFGQRAKQFTSNMTFGKTVTVKPTDQDRYGRIVAWIYVDFKCLNEELVRAGFAWHYKKYSSDKNLADTEIAARHAKVGLWKDINPVPPWEFRRGKRLRPTQMSSGGLYHGNYKSKVFHAPGCKYYNCKNCTLTFKSQKDAVQAGYRVCKICMP